jgi:hypothetical protein
MYAFWPRNNVNNVKKVDIWKARPATGATWGAFEAFLKCGTGR